MQVDSAPAFRQQCKVCCAAGCALKCLRPTLKSRCSTWAARLSRYGWANQAVVVADPVMKKNLDRLIMLLTGDQAVSLHSQHTTPQSEPANCEATWSARACQAYGAFLWYWPPKPLAAARTESCCACRLACRPERAMREERGQWSPGWRPTETRVSVWARRAGGESVCAICLWSAAARQPSESPTQALWPVMTAAYQFSRADVN